jgi:hypothetical protein
LPRGNIGGGGNFASDDEQGPLQISNPLLEEFDAVKN